MFTLVHVGHNEYAEVCRTLIDQQIWVLGKYKHACQSLHSKLPHRWYAPGIREMSIWYITALKYSVERCGNCCYRNLLYIYNYCVCTVKTRDLYPF